jgi:N-dimethylarginine dimethylaminohydrolase
MRGERESFVVGATGRQEAGLSEQNGYGGQSMVAPLRRLLLAHARDAFRSQSHVDSTWREQGFLARPDYDEARREYDAFAELLARHVADIRYLPPVPRTGLDAIYVHDPVIVTDRGAILGRMGKTAREREPEVMASFLPSIGLKIVGTIGAPGLVEGGDVVWLDPRTLAVGQGYRTNIEGIRQLRGLLGDAVDEVEVVPLPHWRGPASCLHLMSFISLIDRDLALVYSPLLPVPFRESLLARGFRLIEVPDSEFDSLGCNVLAVAPRVCVMVKGNPHTKELLEAAGAEVHTFAGLEICVKGEGGPTCLTRPLLRG